jgi:hypothetical protein
VDLVGCRSVKINQCTFTGLEEFSQDCGVMARAGSEKVLISKCEFSSPGEVAVRMGKMSRFGDFREPLPEEIPDGTLYEANDVELRNSLVQDTFCAVSLANATNCTVRSNSFIRPRDCFIEIYSPHEDPRFGLSSRLRVGNNLFIWERADMLRLVALDGEVDTVEFQLDQNLWWSEDPEEKRTKLVETVPGISIYPQVCNVDPALDDNHQPTTRGTELFGKRAP